VPDVQGATPIHYACRFGNSEMLKNFPFDPKWLNMKTLDKKTPVDVAAEYDHFDIVETCLNNAPMSTDPNHAVNQFILAAARHRGNRVLSYLAPKAYNAQMQLYWACRQPCGHKLLSDEDITSFLINKDTMSHQYKNDGFTPLMTAVKYRRIECVKALIASPFCDKTVFEKRSLELRRTVFHICAETKVNGITDLLLNAAEKHQYSNLLLSDIMGDTPLHICARVNNIDMANGLLPPVLQYFSKSVSSSKTNSSEALQTALAKKNNNGLTAFHEAVEYGREEIVKRMLELSDDPKKLIHEIDQQLRTSLHMAALRGEDIF
ncbi:unnamed protein product, partial [Rotaria sp. Silwood1]